MLSASTYRDGSEPSFRLHVLHIIQIAVPAGGLLVGHQIMVADSSWSFIPQAGNVTNSLKSLLSMRGSHVLLAQEFDRCQSLFRRTTSPIDTVVPGCSKRGDADFTFHAHEIRACMVLIRLPRSSRSSPAL